MPINFAAMLRAIDAVLAFGGAIRRLKSDAPAHDEARLTPTSSEQMGGPLEARLTSVVVAALKEAFDRDHTRFELERAQLQEQHRRAEEALRLELRRQTVERELARLRLLAGAAMLGWIVSVLLVVARFENVSAMSRAALAAGWILLLAALGAAFTAQRHIGTAAIDDGVPGTPWAGVSLWLLVIGMALSTVSVLF
jgi:hypothetical protein